jgi:NAD-dependent dihydropyrimidine dehydrogenase PreA subunit
MSKTWYPVINDDICIECGICTDQCTHGVYNEAKAPHPVVVKPEECIQDCKGCGSLCPNDAISYFGDTANNVALKADCGSGCNCGPDSDCDCGCDSNAGCGSSDKADSEKESSCGCDGGNCSE